jgi:hypothetical protein
MRSHLLRSTLVSFCGPNQFKLKFSIIFEDQYRSHEPLTAEDLISPEDLLEQVNKLLELGARLESEDTDHYESAEDIYDHIDYSELYLNTCSAEEIKDKYHRIKLKFEATSEILQNQEFCELIDQDKIKAFYVYINLMTVKISNYD